MLKYKENLDANHDVKSVAVYLEGRNLGIIKPVTGGWAYFPKGHEHGEVFPSVRAVMKSLEADYPGPGPTAGKEEMGVWQEKGHYV